MTLAPLLSASPVIQIHAALAVLALLVGAVQLFRRKGDRLHRMIGRIWAGAMALVALSSFFIWELRIFGLFSPIHLISIFVLVMLWRGVKFARHGDIAHHQRTMKYTYVLGLVVTGFFTLAPGRIMYGVVFGPGGATPAKIAVVAMVALSVGAGTALLMRWRKSTAGRAFVAMH